ncbi:MAG: hypothetical protein ACYC6X_03775 [Minisyncoccota bacterium]
MVYFISILATLFILTLFLIGTWYETKRTVRFFEPLRTRLDRNVERASFIFTHVDTGAFLREEIRSLARRVGHDGAHLSLQAVRAVERFLTRIVRRFRTRQADDNVPRENARAFVKTLSDFKVRLKTTHSDVPKI